MTKQIGCLSAALALFTRLLVQVADALDMMSPIRRDGLSVDHRGIAIRERKRKRESAMLK